MKDFDEFLAMYESGEFSEEYDARLQEFEKGKSELQISSKLAKFDTLFLLRKYHEWLHSS